MGHSWWLPSLQERELGTGLPEHIKEWSNLFQVRCYSAYGNRTYYICFSGGSIQVKGTPEFENWTEAKRYLAENWRKIYDDVFEREVLSGSGQSSTDDASED